MAGDFEVSGVGFDAQAGAPETVGGEGGGAGAKEGIDDEVAGGGGAGDEFFDES